MPATSPPSRSVIIETSAAMTAIIMKMRASSASNVCWLGEGEEVGGSSKWVEEVGGVSKWAEEVGGISKWGRKVSG